MVNKGIYYFLAVVVALLYTGCAEQSYDAGTYVQYADSDKSGFLQHRDFDAVKYSVKYEPVNYKAIKELNVLGLGINQKNADSLQKKYDGLLYFTFKFESANSSKSPLKALAKNMEDLSKINQYCQSGLQKDFYLECDGKTLPAVLFHIEDDYNLVNYQLVSLAFDASQLKADKEVTVVYNDVFFNHGIIKFNYSAQTIFKLPKIKFS